MSTAAGAHLEVNGLTKRFGGLVAVRDMSFGVRAGEILGLIGPNGSGKSTVMKLIMGIERPDAGSVRINGVEVARRPSHEIARMGVGIVFQHSRPLHRQTVLENITLALLPDKLTRLFADPAIEARARAIAARVGLSAVLDRRPGTLPFADLRRIEIAKAIARDPQVLLIDEPFAGLTSKETAVFSDLICELRDDGRAVLLVDHNVKSVARLVDRVLAMYVGERIAEGTADEVMRNETVRRVYLGGSIETAARAESSFRDRVTPFLEVNDVSVHYGKAQALENVSIHVHAGEFVSVVGLNGAGKTTLFNTISGLLPYSGDIRREGASLRGLTAATIARSGIVQCSEGRDLFTDMTVRENLDLGGQHLPPAESAAADRLAVRPVPDPARAAEPGRRHVVGRRAADADHCARADDEAEALDPGRADAGSSARHPRANLQGAGKLAADDQDHRSAWGAERYLRAAARRPRLCARTRAHRLGRRSGAVRRGDEHRISLKAVTTRRRPRDVWRRRRKIRPPGKCPRRRVRKWDPAALWLAPAAKMPPGANDRPARRVSFLWSQRPSFGGPSNNFLAISAYKLRLEHCIMFGKIRQNRLSARFARLRALFAKFQSNSRGNVAVITALAALPMMAAIGCVIDYSNASMIRTSCRRRPRRDARNRLQQLAGRHHRQSHDRQRHRERRLNLRGQFFRG